jgi:hypothetical protein
MATSSSSDNPLFPQLIYASGGELANVLVAAFRTTACCCRSTQY